jgi:hypothetical protein
MFGLAASAVWVGFIYKAVKVCGEARRPSPVAFSLLLHIGLLATSFTVAWPPIYGRLEQWSGVLAIWATGPCVCASAALQATIILYNHAPAEARSRIYRRILLCGVALIVMVLLALYGRVDTDKVNVGVFANTPELLYGQTPYVAESVMIFFVVTAFTALDGARHFLRYAEVADDRRWLRRGLQLMAAGTVGAICYCVASTVFLAGLRVGIRMDAAQQVATAAAGLSQPVALIGVTLPAWGPRLTRLRAYHYLRPLTLALRQALPDAAYPAITSTAALLRPSNLDFALYRCIVDLRDIRHALRPYLDSEIADQAYRRATEAGMTEEDLQAAIEASVLLAAVEARRREQKAARPLGGKPHGGVDLAGELTWFTAVAKAYRSDFVKTLILRSS